MGKEDPGLYDYLPYYDRPKITWPGGARLAFWCAPNIEHYELEPPAKPLAHVVAASRARCLALCLARLR